MQKPGFVISLEQGARITRFQLLTQLLAPLDRPLRILDVGGQMSFWELLDCKQLGTIEVTLLNLFSQENLPPNFCSHVGDARCLERYQPGEYDVVLSNSVIGHVGSFEDQAQMAAEIRRIARRYFVQTPNHYFPVDWRTLIPLFHFLPVTLRAQLLYLIPITRFGRLTPYSAARNWATAVRNLTYGELRTLFPEATIAREKVLGFTKSFMVYHGFAQRPSLSGRENPENTPHRQSVQQSSG